jgi:hypothetical protein
VGATWCRGQGSESQPNSRIATARHRSLSQGEPIAPIAQVSHYSRPPRSWHKALSQSRRTAGGRHLCKTCRRKASQRSRHQVSAQSESVQEAPFAATRPRAAGFSQRDLCVRTVWLAPVGCATRDVCRQSLPSNPFMDCLAPDTHTPSPGTVRPCPPPPARRRKFRVAPGDEAVGLPRKWGPRSSRKLSACGAATVHSPKLILFWLTKGVPHPHNGYVLQPDGEDTPGRVYRGWCPGGGGHQPDVWLRGSPRLRPDTRADALGQRGNVQPTEHCTS